VGWWRPHPHAGLQNCHGLFGKGPTRRSRRRGGGISPRFQGCVPGRQTVRTAFARDDAAGRWASRLFGRGVHASCIDRNTHYPTRKAEISFLDRCCGQPNSVEVSRSPGEREMMGGTTPQTLWQVPPGGFLGAPRRAAGRGWPRHRRQWHRARLGQGSRHRQEQTSPLLRRRPHAKDIESAWSKERMPTAARTRSGRKHVEGRNRLDNILVELDLEDYD